MFRPSLFRSVRLTGGLVTFFFQFMVQSGLFFTVPLFLSVVLELSRPSDRPADPARCR